MKLRDRCLLLLEYMVTDVVFNDVATLVHEQHRRTAAR